MWSTSTARTARLSLAISTFYGRYLCATHPAFALFVGVSTQTHVPSLRAQAVRDGLTIKVGLLSLSALSGVDSTRAGAEADGSISYLPSLQPLIQSDGAVEMNCDASLVRIPPHTHTPTHTSTVSLGPPLGPPLSAYPRRHSHSYELRCCVCLCLLTPPLSRSRALLCCQLGPDGADAFEYAAAMEVCFFKPSTNGTVEAFIGR